MHIHFIAIGGSAMHNLAIALKLKAYHVTGSDDQIFEPSRTRLKQHGLLPAKMGWSPESISKEIDAVVLGMHAMPDNPELLKAQELGLKIYSYPEYLYEQTRDKQRVVIAGSHGKTTTTSMVMHVLKYHNIEFDYMVGAGIEGFDNMVRLSESAGIAVFEGDEYLSSPIDRRPKFMHYHPQVALITGIAWDHVNVFPTFENYIDQFAVFTKSLEKGAKLIYFDEDAELKKITKQLSSELILQSYGTPRYRVEADGVVLLHNEKELPLKIFGKHNLQNLEGARKLCNAIGIDDDRYYEAIASFSGSARRLQKIADAPGFTVYFDFAHSPSKLQATIDAVKERYPERELVAVMELHTFSSLKKEFLPEYHGSMNAADEAFVYYNPATIEHKRLDPVTPGVVHRAFGMGIEVVTSPDLLFDFLAKQNWKNKTLLIMSSGNFSGKDIPAFAQLLSDQYKKQYEL